MSTRNYVSPHIPLWADPAARAHRALHKAADRIYHRLRRFDDTRIDGWRRRYKEHFHVVVKDQVSGRQTGIPGPPGGYYADPFIWQRDGRLRLQQRLRYFQHWDGVHCIIFFYI